MHLDRILPNNVFEQVKRIQSDPRDVNIWRASRSDDGPVPRFQFTDFQGSSRAIASSRNQYRGGPFMGPRRLRGQLPKVELLQRQPGVQRYFGLRLRGSRRSSGGGSWFQRDERLGRGRLRRRADASGDRLFRAAVKQLMNLSIFPLLASNSGKEDGKLGLRRLLVLCYAGTR